MIVEWSATPEGRDGAGKLILGEGGEDLLAGREMEGSFHIPGRDLGETLRQMSKPETRIARAWTIADDENPAGCDPARQAIEEAGLIVRRKIMQEIDEDDVTAWRDRVGDVLFDKIEVAISAGGDGVGPFDFAPVAIQPPDRRQEISLAQIERQ